MAYKVNSWKKYLPESAKPFVFDASSESIKGIYYKIEYINSLHCRIDNALVILDRGGSFGSTTNFKDHLYIRHPTTSGQSEFSFQLTFLKAYFNPEFLFDFYDYVITKKYKPFMKGYIENKKITMDPITNQLTHVDMENEIKNDPQDYYANKKKVFYDRKADQVDPMQRITPSERDMLISIKNIFINDKTKYKIVISPLFEQIKFNPKDLSILKNIFGDEVYDFSGKNYFTDSKFNYFEQSHYRPVVGDSILHLIYKAKDTIAKSN
jgi:hypothetical protein